MPSDQARSPKKRVLEPAEIEKKARALAAKGYSMTAAAKAMQTSFRRLRELCASLIKPIHWPHRSISQQEVITKRKGVLRPGQKEGLKRGTQSRRSKGRHTVDGRTGNIDYLATFYGVSPRTVYRRMQKGLTVEQALKGCKASKARKPALTEKKDEQ